MIDGLDQNAFKFGKAKYLAVKCPENMVDTCELCAFKVSPSKRVNSPPCDGIDRQDTLDVYFVEVF